jgi:hypothetical protein
MTTARTRRFLAPNDGLAISVVAALVGAVRVVIALADHQSFEAEATIALVLLALGCIGIAVSLWHR